MSDPTLATKIEKTVTEIERGKRELELGIEVTNERISIS